MPSSLTIALANSGRKWIGEVAHVAMLYEQFEALGHRPWIICRRGLPLHQRAEQAGWRHLALHLSSRFNPAQDWADYRAWTDWVRRERADVLHCHRGKDHWLGALVARRTGCPLVRTRHVMLPVRRNPFNRWLYLHATDAVLCVSQAVAGGFGPWLGRLPRFQVILSAVDSDRFRPGLRSAAWRRCDPGAGELPASGEPVWFGLIGRFQRIKGQKYFWEAAAQVARACPAARFLMAGTGAEHYGPRYLEQAEAAGLAGRVRILDWVPNLPEILASLDVGVIASLGSEGSSRAAMEMLASGLPLVATRVGGIPELTAEIPGTRLVAPKDSAALAEAMLAVAADPAGRRQAGEAGRSRMVEHHDPRRWAARIAAVYATLVAEQP